MRVWVVASLVALALVPAAEASDLVADFIASSRSTISKGAQLEFAAYGVYSDEEEGVSNFTMQAPRVIVEHRRVEYQRVGYSAPITDTRLARYELTHVNLTLAPQTDVLRGPHTHWWGMHLDPRARLQVQAYAASLHPQRQGEIGYKPPTADSEHEWLANYHTRVEQAHIRLDASGRYIVDGPASLRIVGWEVQLDAAENRTSIPTGLRTYQQTPLPTELAPVEKIVAEWVTLSFEEGHTEVETRLPAAALVGAITLTAGQLDVDHAEGTVLTAGGTEAVRGTVRLDDVQGTLVPVVHEGEGAMRARLAPASAPTQFRPPSTFLEQPLAIPLLVLGIASVGVTALWASVIALRKVAEFRVDRAAEAAGYRSAIRWARIALACGGDRGRIYADIGTFHGELGRVEDALDAYSMAAADGNATPHYLAARALAQHAAWEMEAVRKLELALLLDARFADEVEGDPLFARLREDPRVERALQRASAELEVPA